MGTSRRRSLAYPIQLYTIYTYHHQQHNCTNHPAPRNPRCHFRQHVDVKPPCPNYKKPAHIDNPSPTKHHNIIYTLNKQQNLELKTPSDQRQ